MANNAASSPSAVFATLCVGFWLLARSSGRTALAVRPFGYEVIFAPTVDLDVLPRRP